MSLDQYSVKDESSGFIDETGTEQWTLIYEIPTVNIKDERANFRISLDNTLPDYDGPALYAPCIHNSRVGNDPDNRDGKLVTCVYQRPTEGMILRPGRGILRFNSYSTTKREEVAVFRKNNPSMTQASIPAADYTLRRVSLEKEQALLVIERGLVIARLVDWAANEMNVYARALDWIGKGDEPQTRSTPKPAFTINGQQFKNLKCAHVTIQRRPNNVAIVDSTFQFATKESMWEQEGIIEETWYATDIDGNEVEYDPKADVPVIPTVSFMGLKLRNYDSDVVSDYTDFTPIEDYFAWMTS